MLFVEHLTGAQETLCFDGGVDGRKLGAVEDLNWSGSPAH